MSTHNKTMNVKNTIQGTTGKKKSGTGKIFAKQKRKRTSDHSQRTADGSGNAEHLEICPYAKKCGGCDYQHIPYEQQLVLKQRKVQNLLGKYTKVEPIIGAQDPLFYRNKVHGVFGRDKKGNIFTGIYEEKSHRIVPVHECMIEDRKASAILQTLCILAKDFKLQIYDEDRETGLLRHALIRIARETGQIMVVLVMTSPIMPSKNHFTRELCVRHPEITTIVMNVNPKRTSMVLGDRNIVMFGKGFIEDELCGLKFRISPSAFYQVNPRQTIKLYQKAMEYAALTGKERVIDAYCGIGTIGMCAASKAGEVLGIELNGEAVKDAVNNAKTNGLKSIRFIAQDAGKYMVRMAEEGERADVVFMDPPRSGSTPQFIESLNRLRPSRVIYVSCDPETLKRDLAIFAKKGWKVNKIQPVDMFPMTSHVETVCLLSKLSEAKHHISVQVDMDELDLTAAESKATYEEIQKWVQEKYGFHVTHLNIAQVKRKHGIIERENYNKPKSPDSRQPGCPEEKVIAIEAALKHFQMI